MKKMNAMWLAVLTAAALGGCEQATGPSGVGSAEMQVGVRGDAAPAQSSAPSGGSPSRFAGGKIEVAARVYVESASGGWEEVTRGTSRQTVESSGADGVRLLASSEVAASSYRRVRVEFERVRADFSAGVTIGGSFVTGVLEVDGGGDGRVVVERELRMEARSGSVSHVEIDLNADQWLNRADASARTVTEAEFSSAVLVSAR
ncbi:MAG: hypothetical protein KY464_03830 [Gemmatimonadetes bacterium]|nr:hypothetical protein [Gemmatimonadota bacterium]